MNWLGVKFLCNDAQGAVPYMRCAVAENEAVIQSLDAVRSENPREVGNVVDGPIALQPVN